MATKADIAELKTWLMWRIILISVSVQPHGIGAFLQLLPRS